MQNVVNSEGVREVEVFENEVRGFRKGWVVNDKIGNWTNRDGTQTRAPPEEHQVPPNFEWYGNWKPSHITDDRDGWEYSSAHSRFDNPGRTPRGVKNSDRARRRRWVRVMGPAKRGSSSAASNGENPVLRSERNSRRSSVRVPAQEVVRRVETGEQATALIGALLKSMRALDGELNKLLHNQRFLEDVGSHAEVHASLTQSIATLGEGLSSLERDLTAMEERGVGTREQQIARKLKKRDVGKLQEMYSSLRSKEVSFAQAAAEAAAAAAAAGPGGGLGARHLTSGADGGGDQAWGAVVEERARNNARRLMANESGAGRASLGEDGGEFVLREDQQHRVMQRLVAEGEVLINDHIMREREEQIGEVHRNMKELNLLFKEVAMHVDNQQEGLDTIEKNVDEAHDRTKGGLEQVEKAAQHQPKCIVM